MQNELRRCVEDGRLVYYRASADSQFWDNHWRDWVSKSVFRGPQRGRLGLLNKPFVRWLPKTGRILEAGCGLGQVVMALRARGWDAEGIDYSAETVARVLELFPDLPIRDGDVRSIPCEDGAFAGYVSLGVVEHRREGPAPYLQEAFRVLHPGGIAIISVPHFHPLRRRKACQGKYDTASDGIPFYQYAFSISEISALLREAGFEVLDAIPYDGFKGIKDEYPHLKRPLQILQKVPILGWCVKRWLKHCAYGHMVAMVCRRPEPVSSSGLKTAA